jgi:hypothetical protein
MDFDAMKKYGDELWKEAKEIKYNAQKLAWYMRGGVQYVDILNMSMDEITNLNKIVNDNLETTKKTKLPFF